MSHCEAMNCGSKSISNTRLSLKNASAMFRSPIVVHECVFGELSVPPLSAQVTNSTRDGCAAFFLQLECHED